MRKEKVKRFISVFFVVSIVFAPIFALAEEKVYPCYRLNKKPVIDGRVRNDPAWRNIPAATGFVKLSTSSLASKQTYFKIGYTPEALYIGIECEELEVGKIKAKLMDGDIRICSEDSIEIFLLPQGADSHSYYQFAISAIGSRWNGIGLGRPYFPLWKWKARTYQGKDYYSVEIKIPFEIFLTIPEKNEEWTGNICRNIFTSGDRHTTWVHLYGGFHLPHSFGKILFVDKMSGEEVKKTEDRIINIIREKMVANLKSVSDYKKEVSEKAKKYTALQKEIVSFLKNYEEIENCLSQLNTVKKANMLLKKSKNLPKEADELKGKILLQSLFD